MPGRFVVVNSDAPLQVLHEQTHLSRVGERRRQRPVQRGQGEVRGVRGRSAARKESEVSKDPANGDVRGRGKFTGELRFSEELKKVRWGASGEFR